MLHEVDYVELTPACGIWRAHDKDHPIGPDSIDAMELLLSL